jgi:plasmid stabilization system protein ParE
MSRSMPRQELKVRLSEEERAALDSYAHRWGITAAAAVRRLIHTHVRGLGRPKASPKERVAGTRVAVDRYEVVSINAAFGTTWRMYLPCGHKTIRAIGRQVDSETPGAREITEGVFCIGVPETVRCDECRRQTGADAAGAAR